MARTIDLFLDSDQPLANLAAQLSELSGHQFLPMAGAQQFVMRDGEVVAYLAEHDFLDDDGLPLSDFRYVLSAAVRLGSAIEDAPETAALRKLNAALRSAGHIQSLLVFDLERVDSREPSVQGVDVPPEELTSAPSGQPHSGEEG